MNITKKKMVNFLEKKGRGIVAKLQKFSITAALRNSRLGPGDLVTDTYKRVKIGF